MKVEKLQTLVSSYTNMMSRCDSCATNSHDCPCEYAYIQES